MLTRRPVSHWLLLAALVVMWGSSFLFTKIAVAHIAPTHVVAARLAIGAALLTGMLVALRQTLPNSARQWAWLALMAVVGNGLPFWLIAWGQQRIDSGLAGILMAVMPLVTMVMAHAFISEERMTANKVVGFVAGFAGIVVLVGPGAVLELHGTGSVLIAELAVLGGAICYALNAVLARLRPPSPSLQAGAGVAIAACLAMAPLAVFDGSSFAFPWPVSAVIAVAFLGIVSTGIATVVYFKLISVAGPSFLSLINYLIPLWAVAVGAVFLGERPSWRALVALALVLVGIAVSEKRSRGT